ncbi:hypothetical protein ACFE04_029208 [Oxalis oulophora]
MEARNLPAMDMNGLSDPYVKLHLGKHRHKTKAVKKSLNPNWGEEFCFKVEDLKEELVINVLDEDKYFNDDFIGQVKIPISQVFDEDDKSLGTIWFPLQPKTKKGKNKDYCGEILLNIYFSLNILTKKLNTFSDHSTDHEDITPGSSSRLSFSPSSSPSRLRPEDSGASDNNKEEKNSVSQNTKEEKNYPQKNLAGRIAKIFNKTSDNKNSEPASIRSTDLPVLPKVSERDVPDDKAIENSNFGSFEEAMKTMESRDQGNEIPSNLPGGVLLDQLYSGSPQNLNAVLFAPDSAFYNSLADLQGTTELHIGDWKLEKDSESLKRVLTYVKAATTLVKALKATEEQVYLKADGKEFSVLSSVSTPDVTFGSYFRCEVLYIIKPGPEQPSGEQSSHLVISWRMNFLQSTMMKGMIEGGAQKGLKSSFEQFAALLSEYVKPVDSNGIEQNSKDQVLDSLDAKPESDWKLAIQYFANFTVVSTIVIGLYVIAHIWLARPTVFQGLEFAGLDLPDSIGEFIVSGILILQGERVLGFISRFMHARVRRGGDHGVKAQGAGWLLTVALIEGNNLAAVDSSGFCDPYVVFSCNGKTKTSSIKFQKSNPNWNEIFEFDAMSEPPSVLDVEVYDFDGPFDEAKSLGHAEVNFVKSTIGDLADVWIPLQGKLAQACQSKLHLRIFLTNTKGSVGVTEYLSKMEKEVGKKINVRSPHTNSVFQKLFGLPTEEFLINDFTCHLKRKMPAQGRIFLSPRIFGFHTNLFGNKTTFFFLWEDIEDINVSPATLSSMGSPVVLITLKKGRGADARHGAKTQDKEGRLKFQFQSFVSYSAAHRTIMALWKARSLSPEQKVKIVEQESEAKTLETEESGNFLGVEDVNMTEIISATLSVPASVVKHCNYDGMLTSFFMEVFSSKEIMEKAGCLNYYFSPWESENDEAFERTVYYKFDKRISQYRGEVTSTQQKYRNPSGNGWIVDEVMTLHGVPLGDFFDVHLKFQIEDVSSRSQACQGLDQSTAIDLYVLRRSFISNLILLLDEGGNAARLHDTCRRLPETLKNILPGIVEKVERVLEMVVRLIPTYRRLVSVGFLLRSLINVGTSTVTQ